MRIGVPSQLNDLERRTAAVPETVTTMVDWGWEVGVARGVGDPSGFIDEAYRSAGATVVDDAWDADLVLVLRPPPPDQLSPLAEQTILAGFLDPFVAADSIEAMRRGNLTGIALEAVPRTTLAQSMDALSSQSNIAGYAAVILGSMESPRLFPMMVTAAGTIPPARALILGVGVAGLQAIATAKRLGAAVFAYDIRPETKEQVESLGAKFVDAVTAEGDAGGYAIEVGDDTQAAQQAALASHVAEADLLVTTAQIPGRPAPRLVTEEMVAAMKPGAVIVDMAAGSGGNVAGSRPDEHVHHDGVRILGPTNLASHYAGDASRMLARNIVAMLERGKTADGGFVIDPDDEILGEATVVMDGQVRHERSIAMLDAAEAAS